MVFDEYEYLENTVENTGGKKLEDKENGGDEKEEKGQIRSSKYRNDDQVDDLDGASKRSRSKRDSDEYEKDRSLRYGSSAGEKEKGGKDRHESSREHRKKEEGSRKERNREKDRNRDKERGSDRKRDGNKERREREHEGERIREEEQERTKRSRSHSDRHHNEQRRERSKDTENEHRKERSRDVDNERRVEKNRNMEGIDRESKEKPREREYRDREHPTRRHSDKKEAAQPEADPERDQRTVFAYHITLKAGERDIYEFFSKAGKVRDVRLIMDRNTRRSKGVGYIEFYDVMSVPMAIALSGQPLLGQPVMVKPSEAEKNLVQSTSVASGGGPLGPYSGGARRLYVGNLPVTIKEDQLRQVFESFGTVELVQMPRDPGTENCKGYAFVQFARLEDAKAAQNLNGQLDIAGRVIKVSAVTDQDGLEEAGANLADLDDDDNGLSLNAHSRALLMQKLGRTDAASGTADPAAVPLPGQISVPVLPGLATASLSIPAVTVPSVDTIGVPSECLLLKNMFDPNSEDEPEFDMDIKEDVQEECSKFGRLKHIYVEKNSAGFVYLRFEIAQSAIAAQRALHGRWFAGKMITATFMLPNDYEAKFPDSS